MVSIGPRIQITGETAYRQSLNRIISETKTLNSEMDLMVAKFNKYDSAIDKNKQKQEMLARQIQQAKVQMDKFDEGLQKAKSVYDANQSSLEKLNKEKERAEVVLRRLTDEYGENNKYVQATQKHIDELTKEIEDANKETDRSGKVMADWQTKANQAELELVNLQRELRDLPNSLQIAGQQWQEFGDKLSDVGDKLSMYVTAPLVAAGTAFVKWSSDFTDGMAKIYTIADESKKPMAEMRQELIDLSNQSGYSLEDLAEAEYQAVSASVDTSKAVSFLTNATRLARGGFTSTTQAVDLLTTVINAYGMEAEDAAYISDVLLRTQNDGKTIIDELAQSMGTVIPTAANYNVTLEQLAAAYATMTKQGVNTSRATTFLNAMFTELEKESSQISKTLDEKTGKSFAQLMGEGKSLAEVLKILYDSVDGDNEQFQRLFGNIRSGKAAAALLTDDFAILNYETQRMSDTLGQTDHALEMLETPSLKAKRAIQQLKNSGMELGTTLINEMYPYFQKVIDSIKQFTDWFASLDEGTKKNIVNIGLWVAAAGPMLKTAGLITTGIGKMISGVGSLSKNLTEFALATATTHPKLASFALDLGLALPQIAAVTAGIVGAGVAFATLAISTQNAMEAHRAEIASIWGLDENMRTLIETSNQTAQAYDEQKEAIYGEMGASLENIAVAQQLVDKYNELIDENGQVRAGHQELADVYFNQLATALGMEQEDLRNLIEENGRFGESIQKTIEDIKQRAEAAAYEKILTEAIYRQTEAQMELEKQEGMLNAQQVKVTEATKQTQAAYEAMIEAQRTGNPEVGRYEQAWRDAVEAESQAKKSEAELEAAISQTRAQVNEAEADADRAANHIKTNAESTMRDTANAITNGGSALERSAKNVANRTAGALSVDGDGIGYQIDAGLANGIDRYSYLVSRSAAQLAYEANHSLRGALSIQSPSKVTAEAGKYFTEGFAIGIQDTLRQAQQSAYMLAQTAMGGLQMGSYEPYPSNTYNKTISAPINIALTVEGNVDGDDRQFTRSIAEDLVNLMNRESEVFA